jgi:hypothetical protein
MKERERETYKKGEIKDIYYIYEREKERENDMKWPKLMTVSEIETSQCTVWWNEKKERVREWERKKGNK